MLSSLPELRLRGGVDAARRSTRNRGAVGLGGVALTGLVIALGTHGGPWLPGANHPAWIDGPLAGVVPTLGPLALALLLLAMSGSFLLVLTSADALPIRWVASAVVGMHLLFLMAPLLLSSDVFLYLAHAGNGVTNGLNPYVDTPADAADDPVLDYVALTWSDKPSLYGPLFTLLSYPAALLGAAGGMWALKVVTAAASLGCVALVSACARRLGRNPGAAVAFVGLNPVLLVWVVGGAHNDALLALFLTAGVYLMLSGRERLAGGAIVAAAGIKATAGVLLPLLVLGTVERRRALQGTLCALAGVVVVAALAFGVSGVVGAAGSLWTGRENLSPQSVPSQVSSVILGVPVVPAWLELLGTAVFGSVIVLMLVRAHLGTDWVTAAGWATFAALASTAWMRPWYLVWLLPLAALGNSRALRVATLGLTAYIVLAMPLRTAVPESLRVIITALTG